MAQEKDGGISKVKLAIGAASLFFFIVGLKRSFRKDDGSEVLSNGDISPIQRTEPERKPNRFRNAS